MKGLLLRSLLLIMAGVLFFTALGLVAVWAPDVPMEELKLRWARPPSRFIEVLGQQVHLRDEGPHDDRAPIVLLHGTAASLHTWQGWAEGLRGQRRVIRFDLPGFGLTGPTPDHDYSIERYVEFVRAVMDRLEVPSFVLGGNSLGGQIAWAAAARFPHRVDRLILVDAGGYAPSSFGSAQKLPLGFRFALMPGLRELTSHTLPRGLVQRSLRELYGDPKKITPELVDQYSELQLREGNRQALVRRLKQADDLSPELLRDIRAPALILWGGKDRLLPPELGQRFADDIPVSRLVVFPELGHMPQEEDPQRTLAEVKRFLGI